MSTFTTLKPVLYTKELKATITFYTTILGFDCAAFEESLGWASVIKDNIEIMFAYPNEHVPFAKPYFTGSFYITTNKVDELWSRFKEVCKVCYDIENFSYGMREFAVYDNNGYLLQFGQQIE